MKTTSTMDIDTYTVLGITSAVFTAFGVFVGKLLDFIRGSKSDSFANVLHLVEKQSLRISMLEDRLEKQEDRHEKLQARTKRQATYWQESYYKLLNWVNTIVISNVDIEAPTLDEFNDEEDTL